MFWLVNLYSLLVYIEHNGDESPKYYMTISYPNTEHNNFKGQSHWWEVNDLSSYRTHAGILWKHKVHYRILDPATGPCHVPHESLSHSHTTFLSDPWCNFLPPTRRSPTSSLPCGFATQYCVLFLPPHPGHILIKPKAINGTLWWVGTTFVLQW